MLRGIAIILVIVLLVGLGWMLYNRGASTTLGDGTVVQRDAYTQKGSDAYTQKDRMDSGDVDIDGRPVSEVEPTPSRSDAPGTINTEPVNSRADNRVEARIDRQEDVRDNGQRPAPGFLRRGDAEKDLPVTDSLVPDPPNRVAFGGSGRFQWYRQGNLTWRIDTGSGTACVAFATMEEWRRPIVYMHGCSNV